MKLRAIDLFAGAGGTSTGLALAAGELGAALDLAAVNHWETAVETHSRNHPGARHYCAAIDSLDPRRVAGGRVDLLVASPECTHHSNARGGKPISDQSRASAWCVVRWAEALQPRFVLVENVREFQTWGPLDVRGRPMKSRTGETFEAWLGALRSLGYRTSVRVLNCADFGDATTRRRLFVLAWRGRSATAPWPMESHAEDGSADLFGARARWRAAREIIDWTLDGQSIFRRKRPLAEATLARIIEGLRRFGGAAAEPFLVVLRNHGAAARLDAPLPTITAGGTHLGLVEPFVLQQQSGGVPRAVRDPLPTLATKGAVSLIEPFLVPRYGERPGQRPRTHAIDKPAPTIPCTVQVGLAQPFLVRYQGTGGPESIEAPVSTITTRDRLGLVEPVELDIRFRMLAPHELAAAMSFPTDYDFAGTRTDVIRQIGNAVPVSTARALCRGILEQARRAA